MELHPEPPPPSDEGGGSNLDPEPSDRSGVTPVLVIDGDLRMVVAGRSRFVFRWTGNRWIHSLEFQEYGETSHKMLAMSVEGDPDRDDPARVVSPSYQDIHFQTHDSTILALLVGQSGPHYFSAVFAIDRRGDSIQVGMDIADRCRVPVESLASTYSVDAPSGHLKQADPSRLVWELRQGNLIFVANDPAQVCVAENGRRGTLVQAMTDPRKDSATRRFCYSWQWSPHFFWMTPDARSLLNDLER